MAWNCQALELPLPFHEASPYLRSGVQVVDDGSIGESVHSGPWGCNFLCWRLDWRIEFKRLFHLVLHVIRLSSISRPDDARHDAWSRSKPYLAPFAYEVTQHIKCLILYF